MMGVSNSISRLADYFVRHGLGATIHRARIAGRRKLFAGRMVVFYFELNEPRLFPADIPKAFAMERVEALAGLKAEHLEAMTSFWNPKLASKNIQERFGKGASLWLVESEGRLAGYGWTLQGNTMEPYYFPLAKDDVHLFDFHVFPCYRGRGLNPCLIRYILATLATKCKGRAFIEAAEWNDAQLSSLRKTSLRCLGLVRSFTILGHAFSSWTENPAAVQMHKGVDSMDQILRTATSNEQ